MENNIKEAREFFGYSKKDVAQAVGITMRQLESYENHKEEPDAATIDKFAAYFETDSNYIKGCPIISGMSWRYWWMFENRTTDPFMPSGFCGVAQICFKNEEEPLCLTLCDREWNFLKEFLVNAENDFHFVTAFGNKIALLNRKHIDHVEFISDDVEDNTEPHDGILPGAFRELTRKAFRDSTASFSEEKTAKEKEMPDNWSEEDIESLDSIIVKRPGKAAEKHLYPHSYEQLAIAYDTYRDASFIFPDDSKNPLETKSIVIENEPEYDETVYPLESISYILAPAVKIEEALIPMYQELWEDEEDDEEAAD